MSPGFGQKSIIRIQKQQKSTFRVLNSDILWFSGTT